MKAQEIEQLILESLNDLNEGLPKEEKIVVSSNTVLFGSGAEIDSLSLVSLIVDLESIISDKFDLEISLTDDRAMTRKKSPFDNVNTLKEYILEICS